MIEKYIFESLVNLGKPMIEKYIFESFIPPSPK